MAAPPVRTSFNAWTDALRAAGSDALERACAALDVPLAIGFARDHAYPVHTGTFGRVSLREPVVWIKRWDTPPNAEGPRALLAGMRTVR